MKIQLYGIECKRGWWTGVGWSMNPRLAQWHHGYWEAKKKAGDLEKVPLGPKYGKHRRRYSGPKPPPCRVIGKHRGNVQAHE